MAEEQIAGWNAGGAATAGGGELHEGVAVAPVLEAGRITEEREPALRRLASELAGAAVGAAEGLLEAHKRLAAEQMAQIADAVRRTGQSIDQTDSRIIAQYADRAATRITAAAETVRERLPGEVAADLDAVARRQPAWFVLGALATGFAVGRLLTAAAARERRRVLERGSLAEPPRGAGVF